MRKTREETYFLFTRRAFQTIVQLSETVKHPTCNPFTDRALTQKERGEGLNTDKLLLAFQTAEKDRLHNRTTNSKVLS